MKISFCTPIMNRFHHLKETLPHNIEVLKSLTKFKNKIMITKKEYLEAKMIIELYESQQLTIPIVSQQSELLSCDDGCDWQLKGIQSNDYLECSRCKKRKAT